MRAQRDGSTHARVLLVDADEARAEAVARALGTVEIARAGSSRAARDRLVERAFDVVVVDHELARGEGFDALPVVVLVPEGRDDLGLRALELGAHEYAFAGGASLSSTLAGAIARARVRRLRDELRERRLAADAAAAAVAPLAAGLAHEINNPLTVVLADVEEASRTCSELRHEEKSPEELDELDTILGETLAAAQRLQRIARELRAFTSMDGRRGRVDVNAVIEACCNVAIATIRHRARLVKDLGSIEPLAGNDTQIALAILALLLNAAEATPEGRADEHEIRITTSHEAGAGIVIEIAGTGGAFAGAQTERALSPFFTTKPGHAGMGLPIAAANVAAHGGEMSILPAAGGGATVRIVLPVA